MTVNRFKSITLENDFNNTIHTQILANKVSEDSVVVNSWAWNDAYKAAHISVDATRKGTTEIALGYLKIGDLVTLRCEVMNVSGVRAKLALDRSLTDPTGAGGSLFQTQSSKNGVFESMEFKAVIYQDGYYRMTAGLFTADAGEFYVRNCVAEVESVVNLNQKYITYERSFKHFTLQVAAGATGVFTVNAASTYDSAVVTIDSTTRSIYVDYQKPFTHTAKNPLVILSQDGTGNSSLYEFKNRTSSPTRARIEVFNKVTNTLIDPATITGLVYCHILVTGYDNIN